MVRAGLARYLAPVLLAAGLFAVLYLDDAWPLWFGIPTPDIGLLPRMPALVGFGTACVFGWLLQRQMDLSQVLRRQWPINLALAAVLTVLCLGLIGATPNLGAPTVLEGGAAVRAVCAAAYSIATGYSVGMPAWQNTPCLPDEHVHPRWSGVTRVTPLLRRVIRCHLSWFADNRGDLGLR